MTLLVTEAVLAIRPGRPWPTQTARVIPVIPTYTTYVGLPKICLAFDWPTQMKIPRTAAGWLHGQQVVASPKGH